jgi:K+ transporter
VTISSVSKLFSTVTPIFGYMEQPNVPRALAVARKHGAGRVHPVIVGWSTRNLPPLAQAHQ